MGFIVVHPCDMCEGDETCVTKEAWEKYCKKCTIKKEEEEVRI